MSGDRLDENRQQCRWQIVAHPVDYYELRAGNVACGVPARVDRNKRILGTVNDQRRRGIFRSSGRRSPDATIATNCRLTPDGW